MNKDDELMYGTEDTCSECGAPLEENEDGEVECTNSRPCLAQIEKAEQRAEREMARKQRDEEG